MMTANIEAILKAMEIGATETINGHVVTRWSVNSFEVDTTQKEYLGLLVATRRVARTNLAAGTRVEVTTTEGDFFSQCQWWPHGQQVTGTVKRVFKNGNVAVVVDRLKNPEDSGRTFHFNGSNLRAI